MITWRICRVFIVLLCAVFRLTYSVAVSEVVCTNGGTECSGITNSACDTTVGVLTCKCNTDYDEDLNDGSTCVKVVTATDCAGADACTGIDNSLCSGGKCTCADGFTEKVDTCVKVIGSTCTGTDACAGDANTVCDNSKCICKNGYKESDNVCTPTPVSETTCTTAEECTGISNSACDGTHCACNDGFREEANTCVKVIGSACTDTDTNPCTADDTNSACTNNKCSCKNDYEEKENVCTLTVSGTPCSAEGDGCEDIENAICDADAKKCTCSPSFMMDVDTCVSENAAVFIEVKTITMVLSAFVTIQGMLR